MLRSYSAISKRVGNGVFLREMKFPAKIFVEVCNCPGGSYRDVQEWIQITQEDLGTTPDTLQRHLMNHDFDLTRRFIVHRDPEKDLIVIGQIETHRDIADRMLGKKGVINL